MAPLLPVLSHRVKLAHTFDYIYEHIYEHIKTCMNMYEYIYEHIKTCMNIP